MNFINVPVKVNGVTILATSASINEQYPNDAVKSLGKTANSYGLHSSDRKRGEVSLTYYLQNGDDTIRSLTGINKFDGYIGNINFKGAFLTNYSLNIEPFKMVEVSTSFNFFEGISTDSSIGTYNGGDFIYANGQSSEAEDSIGFNNRILNYNLNIQQSIEPTYVAGASVPYCYTRTDGKIGIEIKGTGLPNYITWPCPDKTDTTVTVDSTCGSSFVIANDEMTINSIEFSASSDGSVEGSASLSKTF